MSKSYMDYKKNIYMGDLETSTANTKYYKDTKNTKVILWYVKHLYNDDDAIGVDVVEFLDWCFKDKSKTIFFHNLSFDGDFISKALINKYGFTFVNSQIWQQDKPKNKTFTIFCNEKQIYYIQCFLRKRVGDTVKDIQVFFRCSLLLLVNSVESLGSKIDIDFYDYEPFDKLEDVPKLFIDYIKQDVNVVLKHLINFNEVFTRRFNIKGVSKVVMGLAKLTIGATSFKLQKDFTKTKIKYRLLKLPYEQNEYFRKFYSGGLSTFSPYIQNCEIECDGHYYDVNSMYPSVMRLPLPYGLPLEEKPLDCDYLEYWEIHINRIRIKNDNNPRVFKNWNKQMDNENNILLRYISYDTNFDCYYFKDEFILLQELYEIDYDIIRVWYFKSKIIFDDFINHYYGLRVKAKQNNDVSEFLYKIFLNSSYGKWGQKPLLNGIIFSLNNYEKGDIIELDDDYEILTSRLESSKLGELNSYIVKPLNPKKYYPHILIAATITSYARQILIKAIIANQGNVLYFDTDSIMLTNPAKDMELNDKDLGKWKLECKFGAIIVKGAKVYTLFTDEKTVLKYAYSGINKKFLKRNLNYNWFLSTTEFDVGSKLMRKKCKDGVVLISTSYKQKKRST